MAAGLESILSSLVNQDAPLIDEVGYEHGSIAMTSNRLLGKWGQIMKIVVVDFQKTN